LEGVQGGFGDSGSKEPEVEDTFEEGNNPGKPLLVI
jgi:hypothetical protein